MPQLPTLPRLPLQLSVDTLADALQVNFLPLVHAELSPQLSAYDAPFSDPWQVQEMVLHWQAPNAPPEQARFPLEPSEQVQLCFSPTEQLPSGGELHATSRTAK